MRTGRRDYDALLQDHSIPSDEPRFLLRAQDLLAPDAVRLYAALAYSRGVSPALVELALQQADAMEAWPKKKLPDVNELTPHEHRQLVYELGRRAWYGNTGVWALGALIDHKSGYDQAKAQLEPQLAELQERIHRLDNAAAATVARAQRAEEALATVRTERDEALRREQDLLRQVAALQEAAHG